MLPTHRTRTRVFLDADVLFAGSASPQQHSASQVILRMAEITLLEALTCEQVIVETDRNLQEKMPVALPAFHLLVSRSLRIVANPTAVDILPNNGKADPKDLPILVAAYRENCTWLVTFNTRHYQPGLSDVTVIKPGDFIMRVRDLLLGLM
ncbi:MAG: PIN domain-containing protein [Anaerolineae bacterium]|nr:PIN domain-containing protein [Anaerolineae bacterium]